MIRAVGKGQALARRGGIKRIAEFAKKVRKEKDNVVFLQKKVSRVVVMDEEKLAVAEA